MIANVDGARVLTAEIRTPSEKLVLASDARADSPGRASPQGRSRFSSRSKEHL